MAEEINQQKQKQEQNKFIVETATAPQVLWATATFDAYYE